MHLDLRVCKRHRPLSGVGEISPEFKSLARGLCGSLEETGCLRAVHVWWKINRVEVLWVITLLLSLAPTERDIFLMSSLMLLSSNQQMSELSFISMGLRCSGANRRAFNLLKAGVQHLCFFL